MSEAPAKRYAKARRTIIEKDFAYLNDMQREAVLTTEGPLLLLAGAGSGKTTVLINRVANLLRYGRGSDTDEVPALLREEDVTFLEDAAAGRLPVSDGVREMCAFEPVEPWQICAITFTNKAAGELKSRLQSMIGSRADDVWAMTFHSACARILRRDADRLGFPKSFTIYDSADSLAVMKRVAKEMELDEKTFPPKSMLNACSRYKEAFIPPEEYVLSEERNGDIRRVRTARACQSYQKRLKDAGAMDFDDLLYYTVRLLQEHEDVRTYYQKKFRYVLIDEYQDTNHLQYLFATLLSGGSHNICVVGDDDQSIYKFRGATIENILSFEKQFKNARTIRLEQNYRSTGNILRAANAVIANNRERKGKKLWTEKGSGELLTLHTARNEEEEAAFVARVIASGKRPARDYAVLYRTNAQSRSLELAFKNSRLPYRIFGGTRFFERAEVKDMLAYLCVLANPTDEVRLLRIINVPVRGIGQTSLEKVQAIAAETGKPLYEVLREASHYEGVSAGKKMEAFCAMIEELQELVTELPLDELYDELVVRTGYLDALQAKDANENLARIENIRELKSSIVKSVENGADLYGFLDEVALYTDMDNYDPEADAAVMMTMHAAKGLEFPTVFIVGAEEGLFPGLLAVGEPSEMEEERRLCYVAITRAREKLYFTCAQQRMLYGRTNSNLPSRFIEEIPAELLERTGVQKRNRSWDDWGSGGFSSYDRLDADYEFPDAPRKRNWSDTGYGYGGGDRTRSSGRSGYSYDRVPVTSAGYASKKSSALKPKTEVKPIPDFHVGDRVEHTSFGKGRIEKLTPMGGDALLEIAFDTVGTKKLMLRIASQHMHPAEE